MVHLAGIGRHEFSVGRLAGCRSPITESTQTALGLCQPAVVYKKIRPTQNTSQNPQKPGDRDHLETACEKTRPPRFSPYSPASIDAGFVEIGLVQLSQSVKRRLFHIHRQTDR